MFEEAVMKGLTRNLRKTESAYAITFDSANDVHRQRDLPKHSLMRWRVVLMTPGHRRLVRTIDSPIVRFKLTIMWRVARSQVASRHSHLGCPSLLPHLQW